jgi:hypothetical protein
MINPWLSSLPLVFVRSAAVILSGCGYERANRFPLRYGAVLLALYGVVPTMPFKLLKTLTVREVGGAQPILSGYHNGRAKPILTTGGEAKA